MRIISGKFGGRILHTPKGAGTRPAMGKTREAIFSMLEARGTEWAGLNILDLFAGTGSLAFEALSRGAASATLVESAEKTCELLVQNCKELAICLQCRIIRQDALRFLRKPPAASHDLVFVDPPYRRNLGEKTLAALVQAPILAPNAIIVAELESGAPIKTPSNLVCQGQRQFGQTSVYFWTMS